MLNIAIDYAVYATITPRFTVVQSVVVVCGIVVVVVVVVIVWVLPSVKLLAFESRRLAGVAFGNFLDVEI